MVYCGVIARSGGTLAGARSSSTGKLGASLLSRKFLQD
jgi:hypothetical protein